MARPASKTEPTNETAGFFPVKLLKNYRPMAEFNVQEPSGPEDKDGLKILREPHGEPESDGKIATGEFAKVMAGAVIAVPVAEAKYLVSNKLAERVDEIPG